jgi:hypothetical protein
VFFGGPDGALHVDDVSFFWCSSVPGAVLLNVPCYLALCFFECVLAQMTQSLQRVLLRNSCQLRIRCVYMAGFMADETSVSAGTLKPELADHQSTATILLE